MFGDNVDFAQLVKLYGTDSDPRRPERRYSPSVCIGADATPINGNPAGEHISTSHIERLNLTMRMSVRRYTRLTNAFSKKVENLTAAVTLHFMYYNFCRRHQARNHACRCRWRSRPRLDAGRACGPARGR